MTGSTVLDGAFDDNRSVWAGHDPTYAPGAPLDRDVDVDVAIVGAGFTGLSTAYHLATRLPSLGIAVLEARSVGNGASGRNGGLVLSWINGVGTRDLPRARAVYDLTREGIDLIERLVDEHRLDARFSRAGGLEVFTNAARAEAAAHEVERLASVGVPVRFLTAREVSERVHLEGTHGAVFDPAAGRMDPLAFVRGMRRVVSDLGVAVYEQTPVLSVTEGKTHELRTPAGTVRARTLVLATNAYTPRLGYFKNRLFPLRSHVLATEPLPADVWREIGWNGDTPGFSDDLDRIAFACMTAEGELVFGGGGNAAYGYGFGGSTVAPSDATSSFRAIHSRLLKYLPKAERARIAHRWTGPVALTLTRVPAMGIRGEHSNVLYALGYSGHGVTLANLAGRILTDAYTGDVTRWRAMPFWQNDPAWIPPEPMRWLGYHVYTALTGRSPRRIG